MNFIIKHIVLVAFFSIFTTKSYAQNNSIKGYTVRGDVLTFVFDVNDYPNIKNNGEEINDVFISGEFNNWATNQWKMKKVSDRRYELKKNLNDFTSDFDWEFKFIVNGKHWAEPSSDFINSVGAKDPFGNKMMLVYNLKLYSAFSTKYGNVSFRLKGFKDAKNVIISGTFNRWDETGFKMNPTDTGWEITLQLKPDIYEYKFIVDGNWITDPQNPSKVENEFYGYNSVINVQKQIQFKLCDYPNAKTVILSGDFNNWSEDSYKMRKINDCWVYQKRLSGGKHHYKFIVDGKWITDTVNSVVEYDSEGNINSVCMVK